MFQIWDYRWFVFTSFAFLFRKKKYVKEKSIESKISSRLLAYTYTYVFCTHIRLFVCRDLVHLDSSRLRALQVSHPDSWAQNQIPHLCSGCVSVRIHTHTPTYTPTRVKNKKRHRQHPYLSSCQKSTPTPSNKCFRRPAEPPHPRSPTLNEQTAHSWAHMHILQRNRVYRLYSTNNANNATHWS